MPTNVSIEFDKARKKFDAARTDEEKLAALLEMKRTAPSHKGGEKMRADLAKKVARLKSEIERKKAVTAKKGSGKSIGIRKEGAGQVAVIGFPNSGKSTLLNALAGFDATPVAPYPFTTTEPAKAMMNATGALAQLVELPAIIEGSAAGKASGGVVFSLIRNADAVLVSLFGPDPIGQARSLKEELASAKILLNSHRPKVTIKTSSFPGFSITGKKHLRMPVSQLEEFLKGMGFARASVVLDEPVTIDDLARALDERIAYKPAIAVVADGAQKAGVEKVLGRASVFPKGEKETDALREAVFGLLGKIRVYTKKPGQKADYDEPLVLRQGATVEDAAKTLHKDLAQKLRAARVWGSTKYGGQQVGKKHVLRDLDVVEVSD